MSTVSRTTKDRRLRPDPNGRTAALLAGTASGFIAGFIAAAIIWPAVGALAYAGIIAVSSVSGGALAVIANVVRRAPAS